MTEQDKYSHHLWEISHPYYCSEGNFFRKEMHEHYKTWQSYYDEWKSYDIDMNLIWRWDWSEDNTLTLFYIMQRKGFNRSVSIDVQPEDEILVREWLQKHYDRLMDIWTPFSQNEIKYNSEYKESLKLKLEMYNENITTLESKRNSLERLIDTLSFIKEEE